MVTAETDTSSSITPRPQQLVAIALRYGLVIGGVTLLLAPVLAVLLSFLIDTNATQNHIWTTKGFAYLRGSLLLCSLVGLIAGVLGTVTAALVSLTDIPGRRLFSFLLALPFAVPAYIMAYAYGDFLGPFGGLAELIGNVPAWATGLRSVWGGAFILSLAVYPYVYLAVRADLAGRSAAYAEAAQTLGLKPMAVFLRVLLPGARAALFGGLALALMETAADFGVSDYFGIQTLSTGIFRTWYGLGDLAAAAQIAGGLFLIAAFLLTLEEAGRRGQRAENARAHRHYILISLSPLAKTSAIIVCLLPIFLGFALPVAVLFHKIIAPDTGLEISTRLGIFRLAGIKTISIGLAGAIVTMMLAMTLAWIQRNSGSRFNVLFIRLMTIGYAIPGAVIAIGILFAGTTLLSPFGLSVTSGGVFILLYAYVIRFLTAGFNASASGLTQINPMMDMAARNLGATPGQVMRDIHLPLAHRSLLAGFVIVFIDIVRELPATLLLRPFNFETLATQVYRLASDERLGAAAPAALMLVLTGLIPVLVLALLSNQRTRR